MKGATDCTQPGNEETGASAPPRPAMTMPPSIPIVFAWSIVRHSATSITPKQTSMAVNTTTTIAIAGTDPLGR